MMLSKSPSPLSAVEEQSRDLTATVRVRLAAFCADPRLHARFLNMLSLMEHIGSRKIMASQTEANGDHDTLKHVAEETRHAYVFKRAAEKLARRALDYSTANTLAAASARAYMGRLDAEIAQALPEAAPALAYLYMSLIVELRAIWFYRLYQTVLKERAIGVNLKSVLAEEELHLDAMFARLRRSDPAADARIVAFTGFEQARFRHLWKAVEQERATAAQAETVPS